MVHGEMETDTSSHEHMLQKSVCISWELPLLIYRGQKVGWMGSFTRNFTRIGGGVENKRKLLQQVCGGVLIEGRRVFQERSVFLVHATAYIPTGLNH